MINLEKTSGLPIEVTEDFKLKFKPPLEDFPMTFARKFKDMVPVLLDQEAKVDQEETYFVYRGIALPQHQQIVANNHLTYDITILPPLMLSQEFNKTVGHYHANIPGKDIAHPELYEVLHGYGLFVLQKMDEKFEKILDIIVFEAKTGDKIVYPPNYGHNFVNLGSDVLVTANWLLVDYKPLYEPVAKRHGMAYYVVAGQNGYELVPNKNYQQVPKPRFGKPVEDPVPMYTSGMTNPAKLAFLNYPEKYANMFTPWLPK